MSELRKLKRGISTKRGDHLVQNGQRHPFDEAEEPKRHWPPSPRAPPVSPSESPRTPGGSQKKAVLGKVKSKAKKLMHLLHHKKKPEHEELMWTPRAGPSAEGVRGREQQLDAHFGFGIPTSKAQHPSSLGDFKTTHEVFMDAVSRQNSPAPSPTANKEQPYFKVSSRFESEMKEANEMLRESKQLRVNTTKQKKTVTFAPVVEYDSGNDKSGWNSRDLSEAAEQVFRNAYETVYQAARKMVAKIQAILVAYNIDRRHMLEKVISVNRYLLLKLEPGQDDQVLSEVITEAVLDLYDTWSEIVERPLVQRAKEISSWFLMEGRELTPPVPLSTHPCV